MAFPGEELAHSVVGLLEECEDLLSTLSETKGHDPKVVEYVDKQHKTVSDMLAWINKHNTATERQEDFAFSIRDSIVKWLSRPSDMGS